LAVLATMMQKRRRRLSGIYPKMCLLRNNSSLY
jgi:hypothetical protein